jgi:hypothetical protein
MCPCPQFVTRKVASGQSVEIGSERVGNCGYAIPLEEKGDRIAVLGHTGCTTYSIDRKHWRVIVKLIGSADLSLKDIPWGILVFLDEDEASQAAAGS